MSRPTRIRTEDLLNIARRLFIEKGYHVTTAEIAKEAGVSEGTLFKRFPTKASLFRAAMGCPSLHLSERFARLAGKAKIEDNLYRICSVLLDFIRKMHPWVVGLHAYPKIDPVEILRDDPSPPPFRVHREVASYLRAEARLGRIRRTNANVVSTMIIGSIHTYVFLNRLGGKEPSGKDDKKFISRLVNVLFRGLKS